MMKRLIAAALLLVSVPGAAATVEVATGDWGGLPVMETRINKTVSGDVVEKIHAIVAKRECEIPGQTKRQLDMTVPFLVRFNPDGTIDRLVLRNLSCPAVEGLLGALLLDLVKAGNYRPTGMNPEGWYRSEISLNSQA